MDRSGSSVTAPKGARKLSAITRRCLLAALAQQPNTPISIAAIAAFQVTTGIHRQKLRDAPEGKSVGVAVDSEVGENREGRALADLAIRLLALHPAIAIRPGPGAEEPVT